MKGLKMFSVLSYLNLSTYCVAGTLPGAMATTEKKNKWTKSVASTPTSSGNVGGGWDLEKKITEVIQLVQ